MVLPIELSESVPLGKVAVLISICSKLVLPARADTSLNGTIRAVLKVLLAPLIVPLGVIVKDVLLSPLNVVPLAVRLPLTESCDGL